MKRILSIALLFVMVFGVILCVPVTVFAASSGSWGNNIKWSLSGDGVLKFTGSGEMKENIQGTLPWLDVVYSGEKVVKSIVIGEGITSICDSAFEYCVDVTSVSMPSTMKTIGDYAFSCCVSLVSLGIPAEVTEIGSGAFSGCIALPSVTIPSGVTSINTSAFHYCQSIESVAIPENVKSIDYCAFYGCKELATIKIPDTIECIEGNAFYGTEYFNNSNNWEKGVLYIGNHLIAGSKYDVDDDEYKSLVSGDYIVKPGTKTIADNAFWGCNKLTSISLPSSLTHIGCNAFLGCNKLKKTTVNADNKAFSSSNGVLFSKDKTVLVLYPASKSGASYTVPKTVKIISESSFEEAKNLTSITVNVGATTIEDSAFLNCSKLRTINLPDTLYNIEAYVFNGTQYYKNSKNWSNGVLYVGNHLVESEWDLKGSVKVKDGTKSIASYALGMTNITSVTLPESLIGIGECALGYIDIKSINIPSGVKYIGPKAFANTLITSVTLPSKLKTIQSGTFAYCTKLKSVKIPDSVSKIDDDAFVSCKNLTSIFIPASVKAIGEKAFGYDQLIIEETEKCVYTKIKGFTISGESRSVAEKYAKANGFTFKKVTKPGAVKLVKATTTSTGVKITWSKVTGADKYTVYRKTGDGSYKALKTVTGTSYTDTTAKSGTKYTYNVKAKNEAGYGVYAKSGVTKLFLATPKVTVANASTGVTVKWNKITGAKGYYVYRKLSGSDSWTKIATVKSGSTVSYTDKKATAGKKYYYTVKAYNGDYVSTTKASSIIERLKAPALKSVSSGKSGVTVKWAKATGADGYYVYRKTGSGSYTKIATVKGNTKVSYLDKNAKKGKTYTYYVKAYSGKSVSASSKTLKIKDKY